MFDYDDGPGERAPVERWGTAVWSRTRTDIVGCPHATGIVDRISDGPSADGRLLTGDGNSDGCITTGFQRWNMDSDIEDQYETFDGMPVYYGGDLYD